MKWLWILWAIISVITACVTFLLAAIDVIKDDFAFGITISVVIFPLGSFTSIYVSFIIFYDFLHKHKNSIRKFLRIK